MSTSRYTTFAPPLDRSVIVTTLDPSARSALNADLVLVYARDFDGIPIATLMDNGCPVLMLYGEGSSHGYRDRADPDTWLPWRLLVVDDETTANFVMEVCPSADVELPQRVVEGREDAAALEARFEGELEAFANEWLWQHFARFADENCVGKIV